MIRTNKRIRIRNDFKILVKITDILKKLNTLRCCILEYLIFYSDKPID